MYVLKYLYELLINTSDFLMINFNINEGGKKMRKIFVGKKGKYVSTEKPILGGNGLVYLAYDEHQQKCAVKVLQNKKIKNDEIERFKKEYKFQLNAKCKYIVNTIDYGEFESKPFYVMPWYDKTLKDLIENCNISAKKSLNIF